ncbi:MAG: GtrA family protein [Acidimicrobiia bacterium]|nr:GtrA family protein [Acidimicrobiia bacterium]
MQLPTTLTNVYQRHARRFVRYCGVSAVSVMIGQSLLLIAYAVIRLEATTANIVAVSIGTLPAYLLNRHWVWQKSGPNRLWREVVPFWAMAFLGLLLSTIAVAIVSQRWDTFIAISTANIAAFGLVWVGRYFVLDKVMFGAKSEPIYEAAPAI